MKLSDMEKKSVRLFVSSMTEPWSWGEMGANVIVGFPQYFNWTDKNDVPLDQIR